MNREIEAIEKHDNDHDDKKSPWELNVQGVLIKLREPTITVRDAIKLAGFDPNAAWIMVLKVQHEPKKVVELSTVLDLRHPGIEKLRLTPKQINNGEAVKPRRDFALLPQDEAHLQRLAVEWETILDGTRRWLFLRDYPLPPGYEQSTADIAIEIPLSYPGAQLDMFYCLPHLTLQTKAAIPQTEHRELILGQNFQRWSRHRQWDSARDTLATHLTLLDESIRREVER